MPKSQNQKSKLLYLIDILNNETDENHLISTKELIARLDSLGIHADRKTIYSDIDELIEYGYDIIKLTAADGGGYYMASHEFESAELKLLVDAVQSSRFITEKKSRQLIKKLSRLTNKYEAGTLQREVYIADRAKSGNESIYYTVDAIHSAIRENKRLAFSYMIWTPEKKLVEKDEGKIREVSPWLLVWQDENYYLVGFDTNAGEIRHYRVDKIRDCEILELERTGKEKFESLDLAKYSSKNFGMYHGTDETVILELPTYLAGVIIDRFGVDTAIKYFGGDRFEARINVCVSQQFFGWVLGLGPEVRIKNPENVVKDYVAFLNQSLQGYLNS